MKAIILAAGSGSRLAPIGATIPKVLVPILNRPILQHHIDALRNLVDEAVIVIGPNHFGQMIQRFINDHEWPIKITTAIQQKPLGTANAYQAAAESFTGSEIIICHNGDDLYSPQDINNLAQHKYAALGQPVSDPEKWGIFKTTEEGNLEALVEKPTQYIGNLANTGAFIATSEIFNLYHQIKPSVRGEYEVTDTLTLLAQQRPVKVLTVQDYWLPIGYPWHILETHHKLITKPLIGHNVKLGRDVVITGSSVIGDDVVVEDNTTITSSTIFKGTHIGPNCHIQHSALGRYSTIGANVSIESFQNGATIHSRVGNKLQDTFLQYLGAIIGDCATVGDNTTIQPGVKIWPNITISKNSNIERDELY